MAGIRIDKWLWTMRICKTRSIGTDLCKKGRVMVGGVAVKPAFIVTEGLTVQVKAPPVIYSYRIQQISNNRLGAKEIPAYMMDITPADQLALLKAVREANQAYRDPGTGRPTKKERRDLDDFYDTTFYNSDEE